MNKKEVIRTAKAFKKILKKGIPQTVWKSSYWDIHGKRYTAYEIAARFLRMKGYNVVIIQRIPLIVSDTYGSIGMWQSVLTNNKNKSNGI